jgi:SprT-like family
MITNAELQRMYHHFNKKWFGNRLPKDMVVAFEKMYPLGCTHCRRGRPLWIDINFKMRHSRSNSAMTLLHEMVHVEMPRIGGGGHGPKFHKRMMKLARQGAFRKWW